MSHIWNRHARIEYYEAIEYYALIDEKLGERFVALFRRCMDGAPFSSPAPPQTRKHGPDAAVPYHSSRRAASMPAW